MRRKPRRLHLEQLETRSLLTAAPTAPEVSVQDVLAPASGISPAVDSGSPVGMVPSQIASYYGINSITFNSVNGVVQGNGAGQTIAIVDAYYIPKSELQSELNAFDTALGIAPIGTGSGAPTFSVAYPDGQPTAAPIQTPSGWGAETALDLEWAHAIAPGANILLVEEPPADIYNGAAYAAQQAGVSVVSMSWGSSETPGETASDSSFVTPQGHAGVAFVAASGDDGSPGLYPAASSNVIAVGGTSFITNANGTITGEIGWDDSGGGISKYESQPSWQKGVVTQSTTQRTLPDLSTNAGDPMAVYDSYDLGTATPWEDLSGTSFSTPTVAALISIADQGAALAGGQSLNTAQVASGLYSMFSKTGTESFNSITQGNNGYAAGAGYNLVTGLGSPVGGVLAAGLSGNLVTPTLTGPTGSISTTAPEFQWSSVSGAASYQLTVTDQTNDTVVLNENIIDNTSYTPAVGTFLPGNSYTWQVTAIPAAGSSAVSSSLTFYLPAIAVPTLVSPTTGATVNTLQPTFQWSPVSGAAYYSLTVTDIASPGTPVISQLVSGNSYTPSVNLVAGQSYTWTAAAYETLDGEAFSGPAATAFSFNIPIVLSPTPVSPLNNAVVSTTPTFAWAAVSGAAKYQVSITDETTGELYGPYPVTTTTYTPTTPLPLGDSFQWQVVAEDGSGNLSQPSAAQTFTTADVPNGAPIVTAATLPLNSQSTSGVAITPNPLFTTGVTDFQITQITGGTLYLNDGVTPVANGGFITLAQAAAGLTFTSSSTGTPTTGTFQVQAATSASASGLVGPAGTATITVTPAVAHTPSVTSTTTGENTQSTWGLVIAPNAADVGFVQTFQISNITGGTLYLNDGVTPVTNGEFITVAQGAAGLTFTPTTNSTAGGSFSVQASTTGDATGLGGSLAPATITVLPVINSAISSVTVLPNQTSLTSFTVNWGPENGAADTAYTIYVSTNNGPYLPWAQATDTTATSDTFTATMGDTYSFYSQAMEAGGIEAAHTTADTTVTITSTPWQYSGNVYNVLGTAGTNVQITPADALALIDAINDGLGGSLPASHPAGSPYYDVLGQNTLIPADVLAVINYLNLNPAVEVTPANQAAASPAVAAPAAATPQPAANVAPAASENVVATVPSPAVATSNSPAISAPQSSSQPESEVTSTFAVTPQALAANSAAPSPAMIAVNSAPGAGGPPATGATAGQASAAGQSDAGKFQPISLTVDQDDKQAAAIDAALSDTSFRWTDGV